MLTHDLSDVLAKQAFFRDFSPEDLSLIAGCAKSIHYQAGALLGETGQSANAFFLVRKGLVSIEMHMIHKGTHTIQLIHPGEVIGWSWIFPPHQWRYDVRTLEDVVVTEFNGACLREKCERDPALGYRLMRRFSLLIAERLDQARIRLLDIYGKNEAIV